MVPLDPERDFTQNLPIGTSGAPTTGPFMQFVMFFSTDFQRFSGFLQIFFDFLFNFNSFYTLRTSMFAIPYCVCDVFSIFARSFMRTWAEKMTLMSPSPPLKDFHRSTSKPYFFSKKIRMRGLRFLEDYLTDFDNF